MEKLFWRQIDPSLVDRAQKLLSRWLGVRQATLMFPEQQVDDPCETVYLAGYAEELEMDWNELSSMGVIVALNFSIFHPRGLAICRDPESGVSPYLLVADDGVWEYTPDVLEEAKDQLNRVGIYIPGLNDE
ncbi:hypothetical protein MT068_001484 [Salmonella enterica]|nr:hypothetical protein [Salmonella enterica]